MEEIKLYQMVIEGPYRHFDSKGKYSSKQVFRESPNAGQIEVFKKKCTSEYMEDGRLDLYALKIDKSEVRIVELELF